MGKKRIVVFYHADKHNQAITETDYKAFYTYLDDLAGKYDNLAVEEYTTSDIGKLQRKITQLLRDRVDEELFFHFSGHGMTAGIPYNDALLKNESFAALLDHPKIRFCFFSSCSSAELVKATNQRHIPVVIGTFGNNPIGNEYAIDFQKQFYSELIQTSRSFKAAFETAADRLEKDKGLSFQKDIINRAEGGTKREATNLNALRIEFASEQDQHLTLLPATFIHEINNPRPQTAYVLTWFDNPQEESLFYASFLKAGFAEQFYYINIPTDHLTLLEEKERLNGAYGRTRPYGFVDETCLLIGVTEEKQLPVELLTHLSHESVWEPGHYKILVAHRNTVDPVSLFPGGTLPAGDPESHFIEYGNIKELTHDNGFINKLVSHKIDFSRRREMSLRVETIPTREQVYNPPVDPHQFIRAFIGKNANEKLINYIINFLGDVDKKPYRIILFDNHQDAGMDFLQRVQTEIRGPKPGVKLHAQLTQALAEGIIIVLRNRGGDVEAWQQTIQALLTWLDTGGAGYESEPPDMPSYAFFLHDQPIALPALQSRVTYLFQVTDPEPIGAPVLTKWRDLYPKAHAGKAVAEMLEALIKQIPIENYTTGCPSGVIAEICDRMKVPRAQVINI